MGQETWKVCDWLNEQLRVAEKGDPGKQNVEANEAL